jgi:DNA-binding CsgD family transcriptional regulator
MILVSTAPGPDEIAALHELRAAIDRTLGTLSPREAMIVRRYYGFVGDGCTYVELGQQLGISGRRINQIIDKALRKLRHPSRCQILRPHVALPTGPEVEGAEKEAEEAASAARRAEAIRQVAERRARADLRRRVGDELGSSDSGARWSDSRREDIAEALARVTKEVVTKVHSSDEVYAYLRDHLDSFWRIYDAWKRDVCRRSRDNHVTFTCGVMADGSYLIYAQKDRCTWYLFDVRCELSSSAFRWVGYVEAGDASVRRGRMRALDRSMDLKIIPSCT